MAQQDTSAVHAVEEAVDIWVKAAGHKMTLSEIEALASTVALHMKLKTEIYDVKGPLFRGPIRVFRWVSDMREV